MNIRTTRKVVKNDLSVATLQSVCCSLPLSPSANHIDSRPLGGGASKAQLNLSPAGCGQLSLLLLSFRSCASLLAWPRPHNCFGILLWLVDSCMTFCGCTHRQWTVPTASTASTATTARTAGTVLHLSTCPAVLHGGVNNNYAVCVCAGAAWHQIMLRPKVNTNGKFNMHIRLFIVFTFL